MTMLTLNVFIAVTFTLVQQVVQATDMVSRCNPDAPSIYNFSVPTLNGSSDSMSRYKGNALIIVNVATYCKFTEQYKDFNPLLKKYNDRSTGRDVALYIAAFPCNQFHLQEPAENNEILNGIKYVRPGNGFQPHANLHIYGKVDVNGDEAHPLYKFLKEVCPTTTKVLGLREYMFWDNIRVDDITWNFEKFVISTSGQPIYRIHPETWNEGTVMGKFIEPIVSKKIL